MPFDPGARPAPREMAPGPFDAAPGGRRIPTDAPGRRTGLTGRLRVGRAADVDMVVMIMGV